MKKIIFSVSILLFFFIKNIYSQSEAKIADSLYYTAKDFYYDGNYKKAKSDFEKALQIRIKINGEEHKDAVKTYFRLGKTERRLRYHRVALETQKKAIELAKKVHGEWSEEVSDFYLELGNIYSQMYNPKMSKFHFEKSIKIFTKIFGETSSEIGNIYMNLGNSQTKMANYKEAEKYYQKAYEIFKITSNPKSQDFNRIYSNLGNLYRKTGNYDKSIEYGRKALEIKLLHYNETHPSVPKYYMNIGKALAGKGALEQGLVYAQKTVELQEKSVGKDHPETGGSYGELANFYADLGRSEEALDLYKKGLAIIEKRLSLTHPYVVGGYNNIGHVYEDMKQYDEALNFYRKSIVKYQNHDFLVTNLIAQTYYRMAIVFSKKNQLDSALIHIGKGMENVAPNFNYKNDDGENPSLSVIQAEVDFLDLLELKGVVLEKRFLKNNQKVDLDNSLKTLELAIELIEKMRRSYQSESSRQDLNERVAPIFKTAVRVAFRLYELTDESLYILKALNFSEKSKASILWQNMNENFALENAGIPTEELTELENLGFEIKDLTEKIFEAKPAKKDQLQNELFDLKLQYENKISGLEKFNPAYFELKYAVPNLISTNFIQTNSNESTALIEYFYDDNIKA